MSIEKLLKNDIKNFRHPYESETEKVRKNLNKLKKKFKV